MKLLESNMDCLFMAVAPRAGAWIETGNLLKPWRSQVVAPRAGAWIETLNELPRRKNKWQSPPVRGRGLKLEMR